MPYSSYLNEKLNQHIFSDTSFTAPGTLHVGLSTSTPNQDGTGVSEPAGGSYARVAVTNNGTNWVDSGSQGDGSNQMENGIDIEFTTATASWGTITHFVIYDASTGGNFLTFGILDTSRAVANGDSLKFPVGDLQIKLD